MSDIAKRRNEICDAVDLWTGYYRNNIHRFVEDYLNIQLKLFQKILIYLMDTNLYCVYVAARGQGKSFLAAVYAVCRCILYPGTKVVIASRTVKQAAEIIQKVETDMMPRSLLLRNEIERITSSHTGNPQVLFKNGSTIKAITLGQSARHNRANILIVDEYVQVHNSLITSILKKFLTAPRSPGYLGRNEYKHLAERNKQLYLSSAYYAHTDAHRRFIDYVGKSLQPNSGYIAVDLPYQVSIESGLLSRDAVQDEMSESDFNEMTWAMEMEGMWPGSIEGSFFELDMLSQSRRLDYAMMPDDKSILLKSDKHIRIPTKIDGEKRLLVTDIALMASNKNQNDASARMILQLLPASGGRYITNVVYIESGEGEHTEDQALRLRKLFDMYSCDYLVIDAKGVGFGVCDSLVRDVIDNETGYIYPALSCINNQDWADRCINKNARKALWVINATQKFNSECAIMLRDSFRSGRVNLLVTEYDGESMLEKIPAYSKLSLEEKLEMQLPYINTTLLNVELVNLSHEEIDGGTVRISKGKSRVRKDRYSALSYGIWVANEIAEKETVKRKRSMSSGYSAAPFLFRAPKIK